jgi:pilus assembly protein CpaC
MRNAILFVAAALAASGALAGAPASGELALVAGRSHIIDYVVDIGRISTSNPEVVDAVAVSTREVLLNAKQPGAATIVIWSKTGTRTAYALSVEPNLDPVRELLKQTFPDYQIEPHAARDSLSLTGVVPNQPAAERAAALVAPFAKVVVNNLRVLAGAPEKQILLRVRFAELNRTASTALGVNLVSLGGGNTLGLTGTGQFSSVRPGDLTSSGGTTSSTFTISDALNVFAFRPDLNLGAFVKALQSKGLLQILAEPNLVTTNGKEASFLVGGEFPVPVVQGGANAGAVTIIFKEFGIRLTFLPNVTEHGTIKMFVKPEVSTVDLANAVLYSGFTIPALSTRRMETNVELGEGQSFVIGGLIDSRVTESMSKLPGLANIPILGALFKSRQEQKSNNELIVMVTPEITSPLNRDDAKPLPPMPKEFLSPPVVDPGARGAGSGTHKTAKGTK